LNRLRIFFLLAALFALATAFAACGSEDSGSPESVLEDATFKGIESGDLDLTLAVDAKGPEGGDLDVSLSGPFQDEGEGQPPRLSLAVDAKGDLSGEQIDFEGGLVLLPNKAYVNYEGVDYEVDPTTFSFVKSAIEEAQKEGGQASDVTACQEAASELEVADFVENLSDNGSAKVDGTNTTKITGDLDVPGALDSLVDLSNEPACESQLSEVEGPFALTDEGVEEAKDQLEGAVKSAPVEVEVGDDDIVRKVSTQLDIEPEDAGTGPEQMTIDFDLTMTGVNEEQSIVAPSKAKPLNDLFLKLKVNPIELLGLLEGGKGAGGLGGVLDQLGGGSSGGSSSGDAGDSQSYTECLQGARSAADIQKCGSKLG
jgi:hypothetical protein